MSRGHHYSWITQYGQRYEHRNAKEELLVEKVAESILQMGNSAKYFASAPRYILNWIACVLSEWQGVNLHGFYDIHKDSYMLIDNESARFFLATKIWRPNALRRHKMDIDIYTNGFLMKETIAIEEPIYSLRNLSTPSGELAESIQVLEQFTSDSTLATAVQSLTISKEEVYFYELHHLLKQLPNIKQLRVVLKDFDTGVTADQVCHALNQLPRLRSLQTNYGKESSCATMLFERLVYGNILMPNPNTLNLSDKTFAYKSLEIRRYDSTFVQNWSEFFQKCTCLAYITIARDTTSGIISHTPTQVPIPSSVVSLSVCDKDLPHIKDAHQSMLIRVELTAVTFDWAQMTAYCSHIRHLQLYSVDIRGVITGLPLKVLMLRHVLTYYTSEVIVRHMCIGTLSHLSIYEPMPHNNLHRECMDWVARPAFLSGCHVYMYVFFRNGHDMSEKHFNNMKRVLLFFRKAEKYKDTHRCINDR